MFQYEKALQYPVKIARPNARLAKMIMSQLGGLNAKKIQPAEERIPCRFSHFVFLILFKFVSGSLVINTGHAVAVLELIVNECRFRLRPEDPVTLFLR